MDIIEMGEDEGDYAKRHLPFDVDQAEYWEEKKILAVPRYCRKRRGTQDRMSPSSVMIVAEPLWFPSCRPVIWLAAYPAASATHPTQSALLQAAIT
jgi:hypothetical protein